MTEPAFVVNNKALIVFSGGQDSTTCLFWAMERFDEVQAVSFLYGQKHEAEIECAKKITTDFSIKHHILDMGLLNQLAPSALTRSDIEIDAGSVDTLPSTFVDGRNLLFLSFASILAKQLNYNHIVTGVCQTDFSGYPDCRDIFVKSLNVSLNLSMDYSFVIHTPLMWLDKKETWALADQLNQFDYIRNNTLTCYNGIIGDGCRECPACHLRKRGLDQYLLQKDVAQHVK